MLKNSTRTNNRLPWYFGNTLQDLEMKGATTSDRYCQTNKTTVRFDIIYYSFITQAITKPITTV